MCVSNRRGIPAEKGATWGRLLIEFKQGVIGVFAGGLDGGTQGPERLVMVVEQLITIGVAAGCRQLEKSLHVAGVLATADTVIGGQKLPFLTGF